MYGLDADHLTAMDGLSRLATRQGGAHGRFCAALFSLGNGAVVLLIAGLVALMSEHWATSAWLELFGAWVSIAFLQFLDLFFVLGMVVANGHNGWWIARADQIAALAALLLLGLALSNGLALWLSRQVAGAASPGTAPR